MTSTSATSRRPSSHSAKPKKLGATKLNINAEELFDNVGLLSSVQLMSSKENRPNPTDGLVSPSPVVTHNPLAAVNPSHYAVRQVPCQPSTREFFDEPPREVAQQSSPPTRNEVRRLCASARPERHVNVPPSDVLDMR